MWTKLSGIDAGCRALCALLAAVLVAACASCGEEKGGPDPEVRRWQQKYREAEAELKIRDQKLEELSEKSEQLSAQIESLQKNQEAGGDARERAAKLEQKLEQAQQRIRELQEKVDEVSSGPEPAGQEEAKKLRQQLTAEREEKKEVAERLERTGRSAFESGDYEQALPLLHSAHALGRESPELLYRLGCCFARTSGLQDADKCYAAAVAKMQSNPDVYADLLAKALTNRGVVQVKMGQADRAITLYERATELAPEYAPPYFNLGLLYARQEGNQQSAIEAFRNHIKYGGSRTMAARNQILDLQSAEEPSSDAGPPGGDASEPSGGGADEQAASASPGDTE